MVSVEWDGQRVLNKFSPTAMLWRGAVYQMNYIDFDLELKGDQGDQLLLNPDKDIYVTQFS